MTHASNPANSALLAQTWEISVREKVRGGGRSLYRTGLHTGFPANREIYWEQRLSYFRPGNLTQNPVASSVT